jgi:hypothetical protein
MSSKLGILADLISMSARKFFQLGRENIQLLRKLAELLAR